MSESLVGPLEIKSLAFGGSGVSRFEGRVIFVRGAVPGDLVWARLLRVKKRYADAVAVRFERLSDQRCEPRCPVFGECGGCQWQMLPYPEQLKHKEQIFRETLKRQCGIADGLISPILGSPAEWGYRSRVQFKCHALRNKTLAIGFYRPGSHYVVNVKSCPIANPAFNKLLLKLRDLLDKTPYADKITQIDMEAGDGAGLRLVVHFLGRDIEGLQEHLLALAQDQSLAIFLQPGNNKPLRHLAGSAELSIELDVPALSLNYGAGGFAQVNLAQNRRMVVEALRMVVLKTDQRVLDLYCGMGNFSLPLARRVEHVVAVEDFIGSVRQGQKNARQNSIVNIDFYARPAKGAFAAFASERVFDLVVLDPPRSGARDVVADLTGQGIEKILYVSCDPMTLARDLKILLQGGYRLLESRPLDMFPQTYHMESLSVLERS